MKKKNILGLLVLGSLMVLVGTGFTFSNQACSVNSQATQVNSTTQECVPVNCETGKVCSPEEIRACQDSKSSAGHINATSINQTQTECNPADCNPLDCDKTDCKPSDCDSKKECDKRSQGCNKSNSADGTSDGASI